MNGDFLETGLLTVECGEFEHIVTLTVERDRSVGSGCVDELRFAVFRARHLLPCGGERVRRQAVVLHRAHQLRTGRGAAGNVGVNAWRLVRSFAFRHNVGFVGLNLLQANGLTCLRSEGGTNGFGHDLGELHAVVVGSRVSRRTHLVRQDMPCAGLILIFKRVHRRLTVAGNRLAGRGLVEVQTHVVDVLHAILERYGQRILGVLGSLGAPEGFHHVLAVHCIGCRVSLGFVSGFHIGALGHVGLALGCFVHVLSGLREDLRNPAVRCIGHFVGVRHCGGGRAGDHRSGIIGNLNGSTGRIVDEVGELIGGEHGVAVHIQGISLRSVVGAVVVPYDRQILPVVAQVVDGEVVPTGDLDRIEFDLVVFTRNHTCHVFHNRPVGGAKLGVVNPGTVGDFSTVLAGVGVLLRNRASCGIIIHIPEFVLVRILVVASLIMRERNPIQQFLERFVRDISVVCSIIITDSRRIDLQQRSCIDNGEIV